MYDSSPSGPFTVTVTPASSRTDILTFFDFGGCVISNWTSGGRNKGWRPIFDRHGVEVLNALAAAVSNAILEGRMTGEGRLEDAHELAVCRQRRLAVVNIALWSQWRCTFTSRCAFIDED